MDMTPLILSLKAATIATILVVLIGIPISYLAAHMKRGKSIVDVICTLPMVLPPTVVGFFLLLLFGKNSMLGAVSYTHLDVYKRQVCNSVAVGLGGGTYTYGAIMGASLLGGLFEGVLGFCLKPLRKFFPAIVTGTVVLSIGLSLISVGVGSFGGGANNGDFGSLENLFVGFVVLVVIVALKHGTKGITSYASIFIGIIVGYIVVSIMAQIFPTTYEYVNAAGETITATKSWVLDWQQVKDCLLYTSTDFDK